MDESPDGSCRARARELERFAEGVERRAKAACGLKPDLVANCAETLARIGRERDALKRDVQKGDTA